MDARLHVYYFPQSGPQVSIIAFIIALILLIIAGLSEAEKEERRKMHMAKETDYLRLKRTRMTVSDFTSLKVIGRGAFGEVFFLFGWKGLFYRSARFKSLLVVHVQKYCAFNQCIICFWL